MADVNRGDRPLSPHLSIYRPQWTWVPSITHRATGVFLALGAALASWWLLAAATGPEYFAVADGLMTSLLGDLIMLGSLWALAYHFLNGVRHLWWDMGRGFDPAEVERSAKLTLAGSVALTVLALLLI